MGKSASAKARVVEYRMSIHFGIGHKLDGITEIRVDEKSAWFGDVSTNTALTINNPNLFGGQQKEGGLVGTVQVLLGADDQVLPQAAAQRYGRAPLDCPAFRGITTLMFHGNAVVSTGRPFEWMQTGQSSNEGGFMWKMNSPVIAQKVEVTGYRAPKGLNPALALSPEKDANFVSIIYECLTNTEWGMGGLPTLINTAGFEAEAARLAAEGMFGSVWWLRQTDIESFVVEMLTHIQATLFLNPNSGLLDIKLLRDDYDVENLRHITPSNAVLSNFKRRSSGEIVNEMTVTWTNPATEQGESITAQDIASIENQGGEKVSGNSNYYAIRQKDLAIKVLQRDLRASTAPLISADAAIDRSGWDLLPGEVVLMSWPKRQTFSTVMRIGKVNYGRPTDSKIRVSMLQDIFSLEKPPIAILPGTGWVDPRVPPEPLTMQLFTVPSYFTRNAELQTSQVALTESEALVGALADSETYDSFDYELISESITAAGETVFTSKGAMSMTGLAYLSVALAAGATSVLPRTLYPIPDEAPKEGGFVLLGYGDENQEFALVTGQVDAGWTLARGCLDTTPKNWSPGTPVWVMNPGAKIVDTQTIHGEGTTATYRALDRTALGVLPVDDAPPVSMTVTDRPNMPIRPANVKVNGVGFGPVPIGSADTITVSWATRNRLLEDTQVLNWTDGPIAPEYRQETIIRFLDFSGALIVEYDGFWEQESYAFPASYFDKYASVIVEVAARRDGVDSLGGHRITITGLPGDIGAPPPGPGVDPSDPPSYIAAPAVGAYEITGNSTFGGEAPAILVTGTPDNRSATQLLIRYRVAPGPDDGVWTNTTPYFLNHNRQTHVADLGLLAQTNYEVEVSYIVGTVPSRWRNIGQVVTGGIDTQDLLDRLVGVEEITETVQQGVADLEEVYGDTVSAAQSAADAAAAQAAAGAAKADAIIAQGAAQAAQADALAKAKAAAGSATTANTAKTAAETAKTAAETARTQAQTAKTGAETAQADALAKAQAAAASAGVASGHATTATQKADAAKGSADAAAGSATTANTKAGEASVSAGSAASSASDALGSKNAAATSATTAATARDDAGDFADAASSSATSAAGSASAAGTSASAAATAKTQAETARGQAQTSATNAATSETNALGSKNAAALSATAAAGSATLAGDKATAAAGSASTASTKATEAGTSAAAANTAKTQAETARGQAQTYRDEASESATSAAGSASTATTQAGLATTAKNAANDSAQAAAGSASTASTKATEAGTAAAASSASSVTATTAREAAVAAAIAGFPDVIAADLLSNVQVGAPATRARLPAAQVVNGVYTPTTGVGGTAYFAQYVPWDVGKVYEVVAEVEGVAGAPYAIIYGNLNDAAYARTQDRSSGVWLPTPVGQTTRLAYRIGLGVLPPTKAGFVSTNWTGATGVAWVNIGVLFNRNGGGGAQAGAQSRLTKLTIRDVTAVIAAEQAADKAVIQGGNQGFEDGLTGWWSSGATPATVSYPYTDANRPLFQSSYQGRAGAAVSTPGMGRRNFFSAKLFPIDTSRKYRIRTSVYVGPGGAARSYVGVRTLDAAAVPVGGNGGLQYSVIGGTVLAENSGWTDRTSGVLTGEGVASGNFNAGTKQIQLVAFLNFDGTPGVETALDGIWLEDVTESENAKAQATASATSAASAATSADLSGQSASAANQSKLDAQTAQSAAGVSATNAANSATNAAGSASTASTQAGLATTARDAAGASATAAGTSATNAASSATDAGISATASQTSRLAAESARDAAQGSAGAAATSASSASTSATNAGTSATAAQTAATTATTKAGEASTSASSASTSATNAAGSASTAATQAGLAAGSRDAAAGSASAAAGSASTATTKAGEAGTSAAAASASQVSASTARDRAAESASNASYLDVGAAFTFANTVDGWGVADGSLSPSPSGARFVQSGSDPQLIRSGLAILGSRYTRVIVNLTRTKARASGTWNGNLYYATDSHSFSDSFRQIITRDPAVGERTELTWDMPALTNGGTDWLTSTIRVIRLDLDQGPGGEFTIHGVRVVGSDAAAPAKRASAAATSASLASASETAAGQSATAASGSATTATTKAGEASSFASQASTSAGNAAGSASTASTASGVAVTARDQANTARDQAQASAASALTQAANASASASSASISANLAAQAGIGSLNKNPTYADWPTGQSLPNTIGSFGSVTVGKAAGKVSANAIQLEVASGVSNAGVEVAWTQTNWNGRLPAVFGQDNYWVIDYKIEVGTGGLGTSLFRFLLTNGTTGANASALTQMPLSTIHSAASDDQILEGSHFFKCNPTVNTTNYSARLAFFARGAAVSNYGRYTVHKMAVRPAAATEIASGVVLPAVQAQLQVTASTTADLATRMATAKFEVIAAAGSDPAQLLIRADSSGSLAAMVAGSIRMSNVVGGVITEVMRLEGGRALFASPISIIQGGRRTTLGPGFGVGSTLHLWSGPSTIGFGAETIDNGILGISASDGFFGGKTLSGPFGSGTASATPINLTKNTWTTIASVDRGMQKVGYIMSMISFEAQFGQADDDGDFAVLYRLAVSDPDGSNVVQIASSSGGGGLNTWAGPSNILMEGAVNLATRGSKLILLQINPIGSSIASPKARNGFVRGLYGA